MSKQDETNIMELKEINAYKKLEQKLVCKGGIRKGSRPIRLFGVCDEKKN